MINLLEETKKILEEHNKTLEDIIAIQGDSYGISYDMFVKIANVEYDEDYGCVEVPRDLKVIGEDWWLERHEYDGSEWWEFKTLPNILPVDIHSQDDIIHNLFSASWIKKVFKEPEDDMSNDPMYIYLNARRDGPCRDIIGEKECQKFKDCDECLKAQIRKYKNN